MPLTLLANKPEESRILVHTLNYLSHDYVHAVSGGKVVNEDEYHEMLEFSENATKYFVEISKSWGPADSAAIKLAVDSVTELVRNKADFSLVSSVANRAKQLIVKASGLKLFPSQYPDVLQGAMLFATECAKCHGAAGLGDGPEGKDLHPQPRNFHDEERMRSLSAAHVFNTIRLGVEGTGMRAHPTLEDSEVWDLAFYVLSIRHKKTEGKTGNELQLPLEKIALLSDDDLRDEYKFNDRQISEIRHSRPAQSNDKFLQTAEMYLQRASISYSEKNNSQALQYASLAYLEGIEPIEMHLKSTDPELSEKLEDQFKRIRTMINENRPLTELQDSIAAANSTLQVISSMLEKKEHTFWMTLMMSVSILFREGLEAFLVILVVLSLLKASGSSSSATWVHAGWLLAVLVGIGLWFATTHLMPVSASGMEIVEACISLLAVCILLYVGFWLHNKSEAGKWRQYVSGMMQNVTGKGSNWGLLSVSFFVVFREVFESVLFLSALNIESGGKQQLAIGSGLLVALLILAIIAILVLRYSAKLPIPQLFQLSAILMGALAIVLMGKCVHSFQEVNIIPIHGISFIRIEWLGIYPTVESLLGQAVVAGIVALILLRTGKSSR